MGERVGASTAQILYKYLSPAKQKFVDAYVKNNGDIKKTSKDAGISTRQFANMYNEEIVQDYLKAYKEVGGGLKLQVTPTFEWIRNELMEHYDRLKKAEDPDAQKVLSKIQDFVVKLGKQVDEESARIAKLSKKELLDFIKGESKSIEKDLKDQMWYEKSRDDFEYKEE